METETKLPTIQIKRAEGWAHVQLKADYNTGDPVWREVTQDFYEAMLNVLPPLKWDGGPSFMVGEPYTHTATDAVHCALTSCAGRHFARYLPCNLFRAAVGELLAHIGAGHTSEARKRDLTAAEANEAVHTLKGFIGRLQLKLLIQQASRSEEKQYFRECLVNLAATVTAMPETYGQDGKGEEAVAHLHYFTAGCDWWITEKDKGDPDDSAEQFQSQAFGLCKIHEAELGYVSIPEILAAGAEIDLHWKPKTVAEIKRDLR